MNAVIPAIAIAAGLAVIAVILLPASTSATVEISFDAPVQAVWEVYTDFESQPDWRSDVGKVEMSSDKTTWTETLKTSGMTIHFQILEQTPPSRLVLKTGSEGYFEGRYVAEFKERQGKTIGIFTEESTSLGVVPKVMQRLFFNQRKFIEEFAREAKAEIERRQASAGQ